MSDFKEEIFEDIRKKQFFHMNVTYVEKRVQKEEKNTIQYIFVGKIIN